jgi:hypothetical protein
MSSEKLNCWEILNCGRQPGGELAHDMGVCPAAASVDYHGVNGGINAGRFCWAIAGTMCDSQISGEMAQKTSSCMQCDIYLHIVEAEGTQLILSPNQL